MIFLSLLEALACDLGCDHFQRSILHLGIHAFDGDLGVVKPQYFKPVRCCGPASVSNHLQASGRWK